MSEPQNGEREPRDKAALITGASSGLGRATAVALARTGADVALVARSAEELESAREEASKTGGRTLALPVDLAREDEVTRAVGQTVEAFLSTLLAPMYQARWRSWTWRAGTGRSR